MSHDSKELFSCIASQGYAIIKSFVSLSETIEIRKFWHRHSMPFGSKGYWRGRPNYAMHKTPLSLATRLGLRHYPKVQRYECFFWNPPEHELTAEVSLNCHILRNAVAQFPFAAHIYPSDGYAISYRPTRTDQGDSGVIRHNDKTGFARHAIQVSLLLSTPISDFEGGGTVIERPDGKFVNINREHSLAAGDLILFDQNLEHEVEPVKRSDPLDPLSGHWRILMPLHPVVESPQQWVRGMVSHPSKLPIYSIR